MKRKRYTEEQIIGILREAKISRRQPRLVLLQDPDDLFF